MVNLTIDGIPVTVEEGSNIVEAAKSVGIKIPALCWQPGLRPYGGCRVCLVEPARVNKKLPRGGVYMSFHFREAATNILTNPALDPVAKIPEFKAATVKIEKDGAHD